jgi:endonuclease/exonuclease/phosphatase family metal-dependent hydrolase
LSHRTSFGLPRLAAILGLAAGLAALLAAPHAEAAQEGRVKVMSRNIYLGSDLTGALQAENAQDLAIQAALILQTVDATDFPARAKLLANEIKQNKPDLIGLQEVALWRLDTNNGETDPNPPNPDPDGPITPATETKYDFLALLLKAMKKKGLDYRVVDKQQEMDIESPLASGGDGRLTMRDVILASNDKKANVKTKFEDSANFPMDEDHSLHVNVAGLLDVTVRRGWQYTEANVRGTKFRFLNTHLEAFDNGTTGPDQGTIREAQAETLVSPLSASAPAGPATEQAAGTPVIALGDFNSDDDTVGGDGDILAYNALTVDDANPATQELIELSTGPTAPGAEASCCFSGHGGQDGILSGLLADMDHQVDHVFTTDAEVEPVKTVVVGQDQDVFDNGGLWPSDHSGLVTTVQFPTD